MGPSFGYEISDFGSVTCVLGEWLAFSNPANPLVPQSLYLRTVTQLRLSIERPEFTRVPENIYTSHTHGVIVHEAHPRTVILVSHRTPDPV